jgi:hypothetical protein
MGLKTKKKVPDLSNLDFNQKVDMLGKMFAKLCKEQSEIDGKNSFNFLISNITDIRDNSSLGTVNIRWEE